MLVQLLVKIRGSVKTSFTADEIGSVEHVLSEMMIGKFKWFFLTLEIQFEFAEALNLRKSTIFFDLS